MAAPTRVHVGAGNSSPAAQGQARQRLKIAAIGYVNARHGIDATAELAKAALLRLGQAAVEFGEALPGQPLKNRRTDLYRQGNYETLQLVAISYASARHGIDADSGMAMEGVRTLCQAAVDFGEALPAGEVPAKRNGTPLQISRGVSS